MTKQEIDLLRKIADEEEAKLQEAPRTDAPEEGEKCLVVCANGNLGPITFDPSFVLHREFLAYGSLAWGPDKKRDARWIMEQRQRIPRCPPPFKFGQTVYVLRDSGTGKWEWTDSTLDLAYYATGRLFGTEEERDAAKARREK